MPWINNNRFIDFDRYVESNNAFHDYWVSRAHSDALLVTYRRLGIGGLIAATRGPRRETSDEVTRGHARIVEALEAADVDEVKRLIIEHRELTKQLVLQGLAEIGGTY